MCICGASNVQKFQKEFFVTYAVVWEDYGMEGWGMCMCVHMYICVCAGFFQRVLAHSLVFLVQVSFEFSKSLKATMAASGFIIEPDR